MKQCCKVFGVRKSCVDAAIVFRLEEDDAFSQLCSPGLSVSAQSNE